MPPRSNSTGAPPIKVPRPFNARPRAEDDAEHKSEEALRIAKETNQAINTMQRSLASMRESLLVFPNAHYYVAQQEWNYWMSADPSAVEFNRLAFPTCMCNRRIGVLSDIVLRELGLLLPERAGFARIRLIPLGWAPRNSARAVQRWQSVGSAVPRRPDASR